MNESIISHYNQLVDYLIDGAKPKTAWKIGTEHEKFAFYRHDLRPLPFEGEYGIENILVALSKKFDWHMHHDAGKVIALTRNQSSITLEPAGQLELSGAPLNTVHDTAHELENHLFEIQQVTQSMGVGFLGMGFQPKWSYADMPWMPKARYQIMREYMPKRGQLGLDMMTRTCTVQVNLDYQNEVDMRQKFRVSLALQPLVTALFADSPFTDGKPNGFLSYRSQIWTDTDSDRTGLLDFVFESGFGFEHYVDYLLDVPMYFVQREGRYIDASGQSFRDFLRGELPALPGQLPTLNDWGDHMTTAFPEVRLKRFLEMRGADSGTKDRLLALPAFWVGLLYDDEACSAAWDLVKNFSLEERRDLRHQVPRTALNTVFRGKPLYNLAHEVLSIASFGLKKRGYLDAHGIDECQFLSPLLEIVESRKTPAELKLAQYYQDWKGSVDPVFHNYAY